MTTYYVKPGGDDLLDGLSWPNAWATVNKAATTATAGDIVVFDDGAYDCGAGQSTWNSGTPGNYITFKSNTRRGAEWQATSGDPLVELSSESYIKFEELVLKGMLTTSWALVYLDGSDHIWFDDCELYNTSSRGIAIRNGSSDIEIIDCTIHNDIGDSVANALDGIAIGEAGAVNTGILVSGCEIHSTPHAGILTGAVSNLLIHDCTIHDTDSHNIAVEGGTGIEIRYCNLYRPGFYDVGGFEDKRAIYVSEGSDILVHHCKASETKGPGFSVRDTAAGPVNFYHNSLYDMDETLTDWGCIFLEDVGGGLNPTVRFKNNIVHTTVATDIIGFAAGAFTIDADYNLYFDDTDTQDFYRNGVTYSSFALYQAAGFEPHSIYGDPLFVDPGNRDFTVPEDGPGVDTGVDLGWDYHNLPDIGAYEYEPPEEEAAVIIAGEVGLTDYKIRIYDADGVMQAELSDFWALSYTKAINAPGLATVYLDGYHDAIQFLENRGQIEIWRKNARQGIDWYCDFYGLYLDGEYDYDDHLVFRLRAPGQMWLLGTRFVLWAAGTADRSAFTSEAAETIMKTLVDYNGGPDATAGNGRERTGTITGISVEADGADGETLDWSCAWKNLLGELQEIAKVAGGDFDLIKTGAAAWEFRWYADQRGTDRSDTVIFALERGNMANPHRRRNRIGEITVAAVGGQGQGGDRDIVVRTGADYSASNDVEGFVNATNRTTTAGLEAAGDAYLDEKQARHEFGFDVLQTPACMYGKHYCVEGVLGDLVTAKFLDVEETQKVVGVTVGVKGTGEETIDLKLETV